LLLVLCTVVQERASAAETFKPFKLKGLDGAERTLADFPGRATLVVFFHPTCAFCNAALPAVKTLDRTYRDRGLSIVWINVLPEENKQLPEWRTRHEVTMPILAAGKSLLRDYRLTMTPTHYLLDATGTVLWKHAGYKAGDEGAMEKEIVQALAAR
jgi:thiol-disulfide isomerase/thioredoxin